MNKKWLILALSFMLLFSFVFAGCEDASKTEETPAEKPAEEEPAEEPADEEAAEEPAAEEPAGDKEKIVFAVQADSTAGLDTLVKTFNEENDKYEVEAVIMTNDSGQMHDQLLNSLSAKSAEYDVISMDVVWVGEFAAAGYLQPVDELIQENGWLPTSFNAGSLNSGKFGGKNYALPYFPDLGFLYYRSDIVSDEDAQKLQSGDYTYDDLFAMAEKYAGEGGTKYGYAFQAKQYEGLTCNLNEFTSNWTDIKGGLEMMKQFIDSPSAPEDILNYTEGETDNAFTQGEAVFARNWPYQNGMIATGEYPVKPEQVGYAPLPGGGTVGGWLLGINANTDKMDGAKAFISFVAGPEGQKLNATAGSYLPGYNDLLEDEDVLAANKLLTDPGFQVALQNTIARPVVANYSEVSDAIQIAAHQYLSGNGDLDTAVAAIEEALGQ